MRISGQAETIVADARQRRSFLHQRAMPFLLPPPSDVPFKVSL
jgi:hypothetical protein